MKRFLAVIATVATLTSVLIMPMSATEKNFTGAYQTVRAAGIMAGDENGNMNLSMNVTRAEFAKMMVAASIYKDTVGSQSNVSPFKDVNYTYWAAEYIKKSVDAGWFIGFTDGTFRPANNITVEEAATALVRLLGYASSDLSGSFPYAQLAKYSALGLGDGVSKVQGQVITREDCVYLFYNLLTAQTKQGQKYGTTLGYTINASGEVDYSGLVKANTKGPYVSENGEVKVPFSGENMSFYRNGTESKSSDIARYDVYYYNEGLRTVWAYSDKVTGLYTNASPNKASPSSVTVSGNAYTIGTSTAAYKLSTMGQFAYGDTITLLLGMDGTICDIVSPKDTDSTVYGVVTATGTSNYTDNEGNINISKSVTVAATDGKTHTYAVSNSIDKGTVVKATYKDGKVSVNQLSTKSFYGYVNTSATSIGEYSLAKDIEILDINSNGDYKVIYPSRLADITLSSSNIKYYDTNSNGEITKLILNDVTGDMNSYGIVTSMSEQSSNMSLSSSYRYIINGKTGSYTSQSTTLGGSTGPCMFTFKDGALSSVKSLSEVYINEIGGTYAKDYNKTYKLWNDLEVYIYENEEYSLASLSTVSDTSKYMLKGYVDVFGGSGGGIIRVIIATKKA